MYPYLPISAWFLPVSSNSCTQTWARLSYPFGLCHTSAYTVIHDSLLQFQRFFLWFLFWENTVLSSQEYVWYPRIFPCTVPIYVWWSFWHVFASGTLCQIWTRCTTCPAAFIFPVSIPVGRTVFQCLMVGTDVAVVILIIHILVFFEKTFFCHWSFIGQQRFDTIINEKLCDCRSFVSRICDQCFDTDVFYPVIKTFKSFAVMLIAWVNRAAKDPSVLITGCFYCVCKYIFMFAFTCVASTKTSVGSTSLNL